MTEGWETRVSYKNIHKWLIIGQNSFEWFLYFISNFLSWSTLGNSKQMYDWQTPAVLWYGWWWCYCWWKRGVMCSGRVDDHGGHGGSRQLAVHGRGAWELVEARLPVTVRPVSVVRRHATAGPWTGQLDWWLPAACSRLARRILQSTVLPHCHHAAGQLTPHIIRTVSSELLGFLFYFFLIFSFPGRALD